MVYIIGNVYSVINVQNKNTYKNINIYIYISNKMK